MKFLFGNHKQRQKILGLTLLELVVSISLLAVLILIATKVFTKVTDIQSRNKDEQNLEGDLRYAIGVFTDEVRTASLHQDADATCGGGSCSSVYFCTFSNDSVLYLRDKNYACVYYAVVNNQLVVNRSGTSYTITSNDVTVDSIKFLPSAISDRILIQLRAHGSADYNKSISYQTAITSTQLR